jgi:hypothetical protein
MNAPEYWFVPLLNNEMLIDSQNKPRMYKTAKALMENLKMREYTAVLIYAEDDYVTRQEFEKGVEE